MKPLSSGREIVPGTRVLEHLHRSNAFDVYDAYNEPRACRVIAKTLRPDRLRRPRDVAALLREGRRLRRLTHPHIVRAYETHREPRPVVVLETLTGSTLERLIADSRRPFGTGELAVLGSQLASALTHLHADGILHLDLKPSNVVAESGRAKLIDLSHARAPGRVRAGNGTWCFMSPEQARGGPVDAAADVWGLGIVLHAVATGTYVLEELADELDTDTPQLEAAIPSLRKARRRLPVQLTDTLDACLREDPQARPGLPEVLERLQGLA